MHESLPKEEYTPLTSKILRALGGKASFALVSREFTEPLAMN
jgi:hypothetical protein